ncbi:MAG: hypothetical protein Ta2F_19030 [Termitinemataceae bacterium]|nr:MAG: hypothetical protein Ta2F_19030 [Termitinemataceae bacterium]
MRNKNLIKISAAEQRDFCSPGELHCGFNTLCYAPEAARSRCVRAVGIKPYGTNNFLLFLRIPSVYLLYLRVKFALAVRHYF